MDLGVLFRRQMADMQAGGPKAAQQAKAKANDGPQRPDDSPKRAKKRPVKPLPPAPPKVEAKRKKTAQRRAEKEADKPQVALHRRVEAPRNSIAPITDKDLFIPTYRKAWNDIQRGVLRKFWFKGGRASFKSTFIAIVIVLGLMADASAANKARQAGDPKWKSKLSHAVIYRKYGVDIHDSTFETIRWVIQEKLGYGGLWKFSSTGRRAVYLPTGQQLIFRGLDDPQKQKSIKAPFGWFKYLWFEELTEYAGMKEIRSVEQSVQRGGHHFITLCSYNPPPTQADWVNEAARVPLDGRAVYHTTFLDAAKYAPQWLGEEFFLDAAATLKIDERIFRHEYLGEVTGTGAEVFNRVKLRTITKEEIDACTCKRNGLDFGFENDPCALVKCAFDAKKKTLYIYGEWVKQHQFEEDIFAAIQKMGLVNSTINADSAENKAIERLWRLGARKVTKCYKAPNYVADGLHWLKSLRYIVIDPKLCPVAAEEFTKYCYKLDRSGKPTSDYVDANNHTIDAVRYALEYEIRYGDAPHKWGVV